MYTSTVSCGTRSYILVVHRGGNDTPKVSEIHDLGTLNEMGVRVARKIKSDGCSGLKVSNCEDSYYIRHIFVSYVGTEWTASISLSTWGKNGANYATVRVARKVRWQSYYTAYAASSEYNLSWASGVAWLYGCFTSPDTSFIIRVLRNSPWFAVRALILLIVMAFVDIYLKGIKYKS